MAAASSEPNYRKHFDNVGAFDVDGMMERATAYSLTQLKEMKTRTPNKDFVVNITGSDDKNVRMFRQRAQIEQSGKEIILHFTL